MRILLISHIFPPAIDGGSKVIYKIGKYFETQKHQTLYLSSDCNSTDDFVNPKSKQIKYPKNKNFIKLPVYKFLKKPLKIFSFLEIIKIFRKGPIFKILPFIFAVKKIIKYKPNVIICGPLPTTIIIYSRLIQKVCQSITKQKIKLIINASFHENDNDFLNYHLINSLKKSDIIWSLTQHEKQYFINNLGIPESKIIVLGNGVDSKKIINTKSNKNKNILYIGSFAAHKNIELLINAFNIINKKYPELKLILAGQKTLYFEKLNNIIKNNNIILKIKPSDFEITKLIENSLFVVQPSLQESFGLTILEANIQKKAVLISNIPSMTEIVTKLNSGIIFNRNSKTDLINKLEFMIKNKKIINQLGENGYNNVKENFTWESVGKKLESAILNL